MRTPVKKCNCCGATYTPHEYHALPKPPHGDVQPGPTRREDLLLRNCDGPSCKTTLAMPRGLLAALHALDVEGAAGLTIERAVEGFMSEEEQRQAVLRYTFDGSYSAFTRADRVPRQAQLQKRLDITQVHVADTAAGTLSNRAFATLKALRAVEPKGLFIARGGTVTPLLREAFANDKVGLDGEEPLAQRLIARVELDVGGWDVRRDFSLE